VTQFALGHACRFLMRRINGFDENLRFQNFFIGKKIIHQNPFQRENNFTGSEYEFAPFGFSGVTVNRSGDGLESTLVFPNNELTRSFAVDAIDNFAIAKVDVLIIEDTDSDTGPTATHNIVHTFTGQVTGGQWDETSLNMELSSVLDAVGTDIPRRSLTQELVGNLPISNSVRLQ
jgi:hypothetical protein